MVRHSLEGGSLIISERALLMDPSFVPCLELLLVAGTRPRALGFLGKEVFEEMSSPLAWLLWYQGIAWPLPQFLCLASKVTVLPLGKRIHETCPSHLGANRLISLSLSFLSRKMEWVWDQSMWLKAPNPENMYLHNVELSSLATILHTEHVEPCKALSQQPVPIVGCLSCASFLPLKQHWELCSGRLAHVHGIFFFFFCQINYCKHEVLGHFKFLGKCCLIAAKLSCGNVIPIYTFTIVKQNVCFSSFLPTLGMTM